MISQEEFSNGNSNRNPVICILEFYKNEDDNLPSTKIATKDKQSECVRLLAILLNFNYSELQMNKDLLIIKDTVNILFTKPCVTILLILLLIYLYV